MTQIWILLNFIIIFSTRELSSCKNGEVLNCDCDSDKFKIFSQFSQKNHYLWNWEIRLRRCWWRMLETNCIGDNFEMLVTVLTVLVTNILNRLKLASGTIIQKMSPISKFCRQHWKIVTNIYIVCIREIYNFNNELNLLFQSILQVCFIILALSISNYQKNDRSFDEKSSSWKDLEIKSRKILDTWSQKVVLTCWIDHFRTMINSNLIKMIIKKLIDYVLFSSDIN